MSSNRIAKKSYCLGSGVGGSTKEDFAWIGGAAGYVWFLSINRYHQGQGN
ncbi:MAG TPA: hypothetical protein VEZ55_11740 [Chitinophagaceae bacterium]|nr:hypothetical protein [Chitinophagaceae bacterium]